MLASGTRLVVDIEEWINKTSGRGSIALGIDHEDGKDPEPLASWGIFLGSASYAEIVPTLFRWAGVSVHEETYDEADREQFEEECVIYDEGDRHQGAIAHRRPGAATSTRPPVPTNTHRRSDR